MPDHNIRLSHALSLIGLNEMAKLAAEGHYSDFDSPLATPKIDLVKELQQSKVAGSEDLARRVMNGEFDG